MRAQDSTIVAALLWDRPTLWRTQAAGARAFVEALGPPPYREAIDEDNAPLSIAALGIRLEYEGKVEEALAQYGRLARGEGWVSVLGRFLLAWSAASPDRTLLDSLKESLIAQDIEDASARTSS